MSAHTPGPWMVKNDPNHPNYIHYIKPLDGYVIAVVFNENDGDISLIATAPELLKAIEDMIADLKLRAEIDSRGYRVLNVSDGVLMRAEKAIAKAKGEV